MSRARLAIAVLPALFLATASAAPQEAETEVVVPGVRLPKPGIWRFQIGPLRVLVSGMVSPAELQSPGRGMPEIPEGLEPNGMIRRFSESRTCLSESLLEANPREAIAYAIAPCRWLRFRMEGGRLSGLIRCNAGFEVPASRVDLDGRYDGESMRTLFRITADDGEKETVTEFMQLASRASDCRS